MSVIDDELVMIEIGQKYLNILIVLYIYDLQQLQKEMTTAILTNTLENQFMNTL